MANSIQAEVDILVRKLQSISDTARKDSRMAFSQGAKPLIAAIKAAAPVSEGPHIGRGPGGVNVVYQPGNLRRSFKKLLFRRSSAVFVGPKVDFVGGASANGYYAHFVEFGTVNQPPQPFVRTVAATIGPVALRISAIELKKMIDAHAKRLSI